MSQTDLFAETVARTIAPAVPVRPASWDLRLGGWQDALADLKCDALIVDAPYSDRTHEGMRLGKALTGSGNPYTRTGVIYRSWSEADVAAFVWHWSHRVRGWIVTITDDVLAPVWKAQLRAAGRYVFQPLPFLEMGKQPRLTGDGPASWCCWIVVARPMAKEFLGWGSLPGGYILPTGIGASDREIKGGKPLWLMRALVRDYSRPGDLICDPCAGAATTLVASLIEGRSAIGAELDPATYTLGLRRLQRGHTPTLFEEGGEP